MHESIGVLHIIISFHFLNAKFPGVDRGRRDRGREMTEVHMWIT